MYGCNKKEIKNKSKVFDFESIIMVVSQVKEQGNKIHTCSPEF